LLQKKTKKKKKTKNKTKVGTYVVTNCKQNLQAFGYGGSGRNNRSSLSSGRRQNDLEGNRNEISINVIPTSAVIPTHRKIMLMAPQPSCAHLSKFTLSQRGEYGVVGTWCPEAVAGGGGGGRWHIFTPSRRTHHIAW
jgi:hypothetical protein